MRLQKSSIAALGLIAALGVFSITNHDLAPDAPTLESATDAHASARDHEAATDDGLPLADLLDASTYVEGEVLVRPAAGQTLEGLAAAWGASVLQAAGPSGYGALAVPEGYSADAFLRELRRDNAVEQAAPNARIKGASDAPASAVNLQWHLDTVGAPWPGMFPVDHIVVAVLDTGVAYEDYTDIDGTVYVQAPSLTRSPIVAPWDFVNNDAHANDDHQHGTHVASTIASEGQVQGIAPGAALMPLKVLDENNRGTELALIDAIHHAVDNGADILNMSLSFPEAYAPSAALLEALSLAHDGDVVMIAASGNDGADFTSWPAASPLVTAVGALCPNEVEGPWESAEGQRSAPYGNRSPDVTVLAPGGCLEADNNWDGYVDGILAETITPGAPEETGLWFMAGTSQAAAIASGAAVLSLATQNAPQDMEHALQFGTCGESYYTNNYYGDGAVAPQHCVDWFDHDQVQNIWAHDVRVAHFVWGASSPQGPFHASVMPFLMDDGDYVVPAAWVVVMDDDGELVETGDDMLAHGTIRGATSINWRCELEDGACLVTGIGMERVGQDGEEAALAWSVSVETVSDYDFSYRPSPALFYTDGLEALTAAMQGDPSLQDVVLGFSWPDGHHETLGELSAGYAILNSGTGISTSPFGVVITPPVIPAFGAQDHHEVDLNGTVAWAGGDVSVLPMELVTLDGTGISTSPFGFVPLDPIIPLGGTGISTSPFGLAPPIILDDDGNPIATNTKVGTHLDGTAIGEQLLDGGWLTAGGAPAASAVMGSGVATIGATSDETAGMSAGAVSFGDAMP